MAKMIDFPTGSKTASGVEVPSQHVSAKNIKVYELLVSMPDMPRPLWRNLLIPSEANLEALHRTILTLFGWSGYHIYYFEKPSRKTFYDDPEAPVSDYAPPKGEKHYSAADYKIKDLLPRKGSKARYVYDLGDFWEIELEVLASFTGDEYPARVVPACVDGYGANPPEDVGGIGGDTDFWDAVEDPDNPERLDMLEWAGLDPDGPLDRRYFSTIDINTSFARDMLDLGLIEIPDDPEELREAFKDAMAENQALHMELQFAAENVMNMMESLDDMGTWFADNADGGE